MTIPAPITSAGTLAGKLGGFLALTKPRIVELLLVTTVPTMVVAQGGLPPGWLVVATVIGGSLAAGGANAINMYVDRDIDALMSRTSDRPLVTGVIRPREALVFAIGLEVAAFAWLWGFVNLFSAVLAASAALFYVFVYTLWLKRTSKQNIVIGGAAGAVPTLIGWTAVTGGLAWEPWVLFGLIFLWTPPHFWALAIKYREDYTAAEVPMMPSVAGLRRTAVEILCYSVATVALSLVFIPVAAMGSVYSVSAVASGTLFVLMAVDVLRSPDTHRAMRLFGFSITYLVVLFGSMAADVLLLT